jgi:alpha-ketoglutarate-dependent taurine dioxygenase
MSESHRDVPVPPSLASARRKQVRWSEKDLVRSIPGFPTILEPAVEGLDPVAWAENSLDALESELRRSGALLFRNFPVSSAEEFERFIRASARSELIEYSYASTPRRHVSGGIYTSTEYPADQTIPLHNEMSYSRSWPRKIWFCCLLPATRGGETPIADSRKVYELIPAEIRIRFEETGVLYVRNYGEGLDLSWQTVFGSNERASVENFCRDAGIELQWGKDDRLTTRQICQAVAEHPVTGEKVWFNQAHLFHVSGLSAGVREMILRQFGEDHLPRQAYYGDGSAIEPDALEAIRSVYRKEAVLFPWQRGDVLLLDNMLTAHGRAPYEGPRQIVVGMAEPNERLS